MSSGWHVQVLDGGVVAGSPVAAFSDFEALSVELALHEPGMIEIYLPRHTTVPKEFRAGRQIRLYRGQKWWASGLIISRVWTPASTRVLAATQESLLARLQMPPNVWMFTRNNRVTSTLIGSNAKFDQLVNALRHPWVIEAWAKERWSLCTLSGAALSASGDLVSTSATVEVTSPELDLGAAGFGLDQLTVVQAIGNNAIHDLIEFSYRTSATPGGGSFTALSEQKAANTWGSSLNGYIIAWGPTITGDPLALQRYVQLRAKLRTIVGGIQTSTQTWYTMFAVLQAPALVTKGAQWVTNMPEIGRSVRHQAGATSWDGMWGRTLLDILRDYGRQLGIEWELTPALELRLYPVPTIPRGTNKANDVVLVWGDNIPSNEWVEDSTRDVQNTTFITDLLLPDIARDQTTTPDEQDLTHVIYSLRHAESRTQHGILATTIGVQILADNSALIGKLNAAMEGRSDVAVSFDVPVKFDTPGLEDLGIGDIVTLVVPEHGVRMPVRVHGIRIETAKGRETWTLKLSTIARTAFDTERTNPTADQIVMGVPPSTDEALAVVGIVQAVARR